MNAGGPTCSTCGGLNVNANQSNNQCRFCGQPLPMMQQQQQQYAQPGYGQQQQQMGYGGGGGYGQAPNPYAYGQPPPNPYGQYQQYPPVQPFGGYVQPPRYRNNGWASGWSTFFWVRLTIAAIAIGVSLIGACISALSH